MKLTRFTRLHESHTLYFFFFSSIRFKFSNSNITMITSNIIHSSVVLISKSKQYFN